MARLFQALVAAAMLAALIPLQLSLASAQSLFEKLVNPGPLVEGHAKFEKDCPQCHERFSQHTQSRLCTACHKALATDISQGTGFHGRNPAIRNSECRSCHTDHKGRDADIVGLDPQMFRHDITDFPLQGAHASVSCTGCHENGKRMRDAPSACVACHKKNDPHGARLGTECASCHSLETWRKSKSFDHGKTRFPLVGAHQGVNCQACHALQHWKGIGTSCVGCHRLQEPHSGRYGSKCETCHSAAKWKSIRFDHDKATRFPLRGEHRKLACDGCHTGNLYTDKLKTACNACHESDDPHNGGLGTRCERCHTEQGWRRSTAIDHDFTRFPLIGLHATVPCEGCHLSRNFKGTSRDCGACHADNHHEGRLGARCEQCHNPNGWQLWRFDHAQQTHFALTGAHEGAGCHACHREKNPAALALSTECYSCHSQDDKHRGAFGRSCGTCHSTATFSAQMRRR